MSDRPIHQDADPEANIPAPVRAGPSMRVTQEQLAAAERTRDYHVRRLQRTFIAREPTPEAGTRSEH
jgi:hypothetical protein